MLYLRDVADADKLVAAIEVTKNKGGKAVVIGAGFIGMEVSAALCQAQLPVTLVYPSAHVMDRFFPDALATFYETQYKEEGVSLCPGKKVVDIETNSDNGCVTHVVLDDGTKLQADLVVIGIGAIANIELVRDQLTIDSGGVLVTSQLRTESYPEIFCIGDVATFPVNGKPYRCEHVDHARKSAAHAMKIMLNPDCTDTYDYLPYYYSRVFNLNWKFYGHLTPSCKLQNMENSANPRAYWLDGENNIQGAFLESGTDEEYEHLKNMVVHHSAL